MTKAHATDLLIPVLGGVVGFIAWGHGIPQMSALMPLLWSFAPRTSIAAACAFCYYLMGSRIIQEAAAGYFGASGEGIVGILLWVASAAILTVPWAIAHHAARSARARAATAVLAVLVLSVPPFGLIGWLNPWLGAAQFAPGMGLASLLFGLGVIGAFAAAPCHRGRARPLIVGVLATWTVAAIAYTPDLAQRPEWVAITTYEGRLDLSRADDTRRLIAITQQTAAAVKDGARVVVWPEAYVGDRAAAAQQFLEQSLGWMLEAKGAQVLIGAEVAAGQGTTNSALAFDGQAWAQLDARHAVPIALWRPWDASSTQVRWMGPAMHEIKGTRIWLSICFEDYVVWPHLATLLAGRPDMLISMANAWWSSSPAAIRIQQDHAQSWARITGLPLVRAVNHPAPRGEAAT